MPKITIVRKARPHRFILVRGTGKNAKQIKFPGGFVKSFQDRATAAMVAYWLRRS